METIIKHFTPAMAAFVVGILMLGIFMVILASNGPVAEMMTEFIKTLLTKLTSVQLPTIS